MVESFGQVWSGIRLGKGSVSVTRFAGGLAARLAKSPDWISDDVKGSGPLGCVQRSGFASLQVTASGEIDVCITTVVFPLGTFWISAQIAKLMLVSPSVSKRAHALPV